MLPYEKGPNLWTLQAIVVYMGSCGKWHNDITIAFGGSSVHVHLSQVSPPHAQIQIHADTTTSSHDPSKLQEQLQSQGFEKCVWLCT